jgi:hypothetical protein
MMGCAAALGIAIAAVANAGDGRTCPGDTPNPTAGVVLNLRVFNDCPFSTLVTNNVFPFLVEIDDQNMSCAGFANLHTWSFSTDGVNPAEFENCSHYRFHAEMVLDGTGEGEGGLRISPWWSPHADGLFNVRTTDGEIAVFGGRLPFFSFSNPNLPPPLGGGFSLHYVKGTPITLDMTYDPRALDALYPATVQYQVFYQGQLYDSGEIPFDMGNPTQDPPHGLYGALYPHYAGGHMKAFAPGTTGPPTNFKAAWSNICFAGPWATPVKVTSWNKLKAMYR